MERERAQIKKRSGSDAVLKKRAKEEEEKRKDKRHHHIHMARPDESNKEEGQIVGVKRMRRKKTLW